eukprot:5706213-Prymnesium_polylepis.1
MRMSNGLIAAKRTSQPSPETPKTPLSPDPLRTPGGALKDRMLKRGNTMTNMVNDFFRQGAPQTSVEREITSTEVIYKLVTEEKEAVFPSQYFGDIIELLEENIDNIIVVSPTMHSAELPSELQHLDR